VPIVALSPKLRTVRELNLVWGVRSMHVPQNLGNDLEERSINALKQVRSLRRSLPPTCSF
jgi:pyruvate kinase